jgi:hypothetical protein
LNNVDNKQVPAVKYLGVYLDEKLSWRYHIDHVSKKLSQLTGAFYHLSKFLPYESVCDIYYAYIFPHIKYGIEVYGTCSKTLLNVLQVQQNKLLKILCKRNIRDSATALHQELGLLSCQNVNEQFTLLFVFKQRNNLLPNIFMDYYKLVGDVNVRSSRQSNLIFVLRHRLQAGALSMKIYGAQHWNDVPIELREIKSLNIFKRKVKTYLLANH